MYMYIYPYIHTHPCSYDIAWFHVHIPKSKCCEKNPGHADSPGLGGPKSRGAGLAAQAAQVSHGEVDD